jgi:cytochrome bd ubiquinol oxidase subunit I
MAENFDYSLIDWSRAQFALTAMYHWLFVPLTLGLSFVIAIMESLYVKTGDEQWKRITKFWMTLFGVNFAIGVATGIILEFEFGTNWSNYSWFVGDIFGAPLAIEGIMAFFLESTFIAVMFFGWNKVGKKFHLTSTWLVAIGSNLSALWILVANGWMQNPVGMHFNPDTARNEMQNFWDVLLSPNAINKFFHTVTSSYTLSCLFVIGISSWFLLKKREILMAKRSILIAGIFGLLSAILTAASGDGSAKQVAISQPMKLAAAEGLYQGKENAELVMAGILKQSDSQLDNPKMKEFAFKIEIPSVLSFLAFGNFNAFVPGINDLIKGNEKRGILSAQEKIDRGRLARNTLREYTQTRKAGDTLKANLLKAKFTDKNFQKNYFRYFGYGFLNNVNDLIPNIPLTFHSFHIMVALGFYFILLFALFLFLLYRNKLDGKRWLLWIALFTIPLGYVASQCGWIVAEVGRQPWVIQDLLPTAAAVSQIDASAVQVTFILFAIIFTSLLIAEISIMVKQVKIGPKEGGK